MHSTLVYAAVIVLLIAPTPLTLAEATPITILDFELHDLTLQPKTTEELERTASIKPLLSEILFREHGFQLAKVSMKQQRSTEHGFGYLFNHHDVAAQLGKDAGAEWIIVGRVHKASFLFVYFIAHVINTKTEQLVGDLVVEVKGPQKKMTIEGIESLAKQIAKTIRQKEKPLEKLSTT